MPDDGTALGVDFGTRAIKLILLRRAATRLMVDLAGTLPLQPGAIEGGRIVDPKSVGRSLAKYLVSAGVKPTRAVFSIPSGLAVLRWLHLPALEAEELRDAARFKVKRHLPFPVESAYIETIAPVSGEGPTMIAAVPRTALDSRAETLLFAGLEPVHAELEAQALLRVMERRLDHQGALWRNASLTIIDIGAYSTTMYVLQGRRLQFIRALKFGADGLHTALEQGLGRSAAECAGLLSHPETVLRPDGRLLIPMNGAVGMVDVRQELDRFTKEVTRLMRYFRSLHPERSYAGILDQAVLCGGVVGLPGLSEYLATALGLRMELSRPIAGLVTRFNRETFAEVSRRQEQLAAAMGLALAGLAPRSDEQEESRGRNYAWHRVA